MPALLIAASSAAQSASAISRYVRMPASIRAAAIFGPMPSMRARSSGSTGSGSTTAELVGGGREHRAWLSSGDQVIGESLNPSSSPMASSAACCDQELMLGVKAIFAAFVAACSAARSASASCS